MSLRADGVRNARGEQGVLRRLAEFVFYTLVLAGLVALATVTIRDYEAGRRGISFGDPPPATALPAPPLGTNASLEQYRDPAILDQVINAARVHGFAWIRQRFPWAEIEPAPGKYDWTRWDGIVDAVARNHLQLIAVLETSPGWARAEADGDNRFAPPRDPADFARFVAAFCTRYTARARYVQLWDEPNIAPHWGSRRVDPAGYVALLRAGYASAKHAYPDVVVLGGGLAPTLEATTANLNDVEYLRRMYGAGARGAFDVLAVKPYGFWSGADDPRISPDVLNFPRVVLLRRQMLAAGDAEHAAWAVEMGWNALPDGWSGPPSPWGSDTADQQASRLIRAVDRARDEWPWLQVLVVQHLQPAAPPDDPVQGFALLGYNLAFRPQYASLAQDTGILGAAGPGRYAAGYPTVTYGTGWTTQTGEAYSAVEGAQVTIRFRGTRLGAHGNMSFSPAKVTVTVDGRRRGDASVEGGREKTLAEGLPFGIHTAELTLQGMASIDEWIVSRDEDAAGFYASLLALAAGTVLIGWRWGRAGRQLPWDSFARANAAGWARLGERGQLVAMIVLAATFYAMPSSIISTAVLVVLASLALARLDLALAVLVFSIPFFLRPKALFGKAFSMVEIMTLVGIAAWLAQSAVLDDGFRTMGFIQNPKPIIGILKSRIRSIDLAVGLILVLGIVSPLVAEAPGVATRELRVVIVEPVLLYALLRVYPLDRRGIWRLVDALVLAGVALSLHAMFQFVTTQGIIRAEGVYRVRSLYGSPNNLSLFLDRVLPITLAVAAFGRHRWRRVMYAAASLLIGVALFLTFSRAAWLLGIPAALVFIGLMRGRRTRLAVLGLLAAAVLALVPLFRVERIASLLNPWGGTTFLRIKLWEASLHIIRDHPLFGVGLDNFLYFYRDRYVLPEALAEPNLSHPHNIVLHFWVQLGVLGVVAIVWLLAAFFRLAVRTYRQLADPDLQALVLGLTASMVATVAHGMADQSFFLVDLAFVFMLTVALVIRLTAMSEDAIIDGKQV